LLVPSGKAKRLIERLTFFWLISLGESPYAPFMQKMTKKYDATGIVTAAREYRAGRAVVFTVRPVPST
jgi:hypothetical protein